MNNTSFPCSKPEAEQERKFVIMKFGGTSVGTAERIKHVAGLIVQEKRPRIVVLSAMGGVTNKLAEIATHYYARNHNVAKACIEELRKRYCQVTEELYKEEVNKRAVDLFVAKILDRIQSFGQDLFTIFEEQQLMVQGEYISTEMMRTYLEEAGVSAVKLNATDFMRTNKYAEPELKKIRELLLPRLEETKEENIYICEGYVCKNAYGEIDNLKRGGSDYTATLLGAAINAEEIQIWTDIDGIHNNDPRVVDGTEAVRRLHFEEAAEMAYFGAKILHPTCTIPAKMHNIPLRILNTMEPHAEGTLISNAIEEGRLKAVSAKDQITVLKISSKREILSYGFTAKVFSVFEKHRTPIDMLTMSEVSLSVCIEDISKLQEIVNELRSFSSVSIDKDMVIVCVVGDLNWRNVGFETAILNALSDIPVRMISYGGSNYNVSILVRAEDKAATLRSLSQHLFSTSLDS